MTKGNPRDSGYTLAEDGWYVEPPEAVHALFRAEPFPGVSWDPACGAGNILKVASQYGHTIMCSDIVDRGCNAARLDFLTAGRDIPPVDNIITNPPYHILDEFVLHALASATRKVAIFVPLARLEGLTRYETIYKPHRPSRVLVFSNRVSCPPGGRGIKPKGGAVAYCWIIFNKTYFGPTILDWVKA